MGKDNEPHVGSTGRNAEPLPPEWEKLISGETATRTECQLNLGEDAPAPGRGFQRVNLDQASAFMAKWHKEAEAMLLGWEDGQADPADLTRMLARMPGVKSVPQVTASRIGATHGGFYAVRGVEDMRFEFTIEGALAAFFCLDDLQRIGAWWHGLHGREYTYSLELWPLAQILWDAEGLFPTDEKAAECLRNAPGPVVSRAGEDILLRWLCCTLRGSSLTWRGISLCRSGSARALEPEAVVNGTWYVY